MKQQNGKYDNAGDFRISQKFSERFKKLNSSTGIIGERIVEEASIAKRIEETSSDVVSFRNSKKNKNLNQTEDNTNHTDHNLYEESTSQEVCTYISNEVSR